MRTGIPSATRPTRLVLLSTLLLWGTASDAQNRIVLNADLGRDTISRRIYGHFRWKSW